MPVNQVTPGGIPGSSLSAGIPVNQLGDNLGGGIISELHGKYYNLARAGMVFHGATAAAGVLVPASSTTAPTFALWNPSNSGKNLELLFYRLGWVVTTGAPGTVLYMALTGVGANVGTGAPVTAFTSGAPSNGIIGGGLNSIAKFAPATATLTTAGSVYGSPGFSQLTTTGTATFGTVPLIDYIDGAIIIPPGVLFYTAGTAALLSSFFQEFVWAEVPV